MPPGATGSGKGVSTTIETTHKGSEAKTVYVRSYLRCRLGKWETVTDHFRSPPCR